ncbi:MAG: 50S ribosome-binding GTPase [Desulfurococcales archaeon]|nr:50S ribosome-binding GTPase [Desulfurococcales archaeon]
MDLASWRLLARTVKKADLVVEVVDIRDPVSTHSWRLVEMIDALDRELVIVLNKADLVPLHVAIGWKDRFEEAGFNAFYVSANKRLGTRRLRGYIKHLVDTIPFTVAVVGYPKTGKSSIINALKGKHSAQTSPVPGSPGYTRHAQLYKIEPGFYMIDTPGVIPVEGGWPDSIIRGRSPEELPDPVPPAAALIEKILQYRPNAIAEAYGITETDPYKIMEELALARGWKYRLTGEPLIEEAARVIIRDYHKAKIPFYIPPQPIRRPRQR